MTLAFMQSGFGPALAPALGPALGPVLGPAIGLALGLILGLAHFASLRGVVALWLTGRSAPRALALHLARFAVLGASLFGLALIGAAPLLAGALGVVLARGVVLRLAAKEASWTAR